MTASAQPCQKRHRPQKHAGSLRKKGKSARVIHLKSQLTIDIMISMMFTQGNI